MPFSNEYPCRLVNLDPYLTKITLRLPLKNFNINVVLNMCDHPNISMNNKYTQPDYQVSMYFVENPPHNFSAMLI